MALRISDKRHLCAEESMENVLWDCFLTKNNWMKITGWWFAHVKRHFVGFHGFNRNAKLHNHGQ